MKTIGVIADFAGIISLVITAITFVFTTKIKRSVQIYADKTDYQKESKEVITTLEVFCETLLESDSDVNPKFFFAIWKSLDDISILYENAIPSKLRKDIDRLKESVDSDKQILTKDYKGYAKQLSSIITRLKKIQKMH